MGRSPGPAWEAWITSCLPWCPAPPLGTHSPRRLSLPTLCASSSTSPPDVGPCGTATAWPDAAGGTQRWPRPGPRGHHTRLPMSHPGSWGGIRRRHTGAGPSVSERFALSLTSPRDRSHTRGHAGSHGAHAHALGLAGMGFDSTPFTETHYTPPLKQELSLRNFQKS